jgi:uncharacterized LabA/DUF88 family protein
MSPSDRGVGSLDEFFYTPLINKNYKVLSSAFFNERNGNFEYNQKGVDTLLTMDMMNLPLKYPNLKKVILIASDSDFVPVIKEINKFGIKTILYTYYVKGRKTRFSTSNELFQVVSKYVLITKEDFKQAKRK